AARLGDDEPRLVFLPADTPGLTIVDDWTGMGQRTTASGSVLLEGVRVPAGNVCAFWENTPEGVFTLHGPLAAAAIHVGIARAAFRDLITYATTRARPWTASGADRAADDPYVQRAVGELRTQLDAAEVLFERALELLQDAIDRPSAEARAAASL